MSEAYHAPNTLIPINTIIEDYSGTPYLASLAFFWEVELAAIYQQHPHLNPTAFFNFDYDEEEIQEELFKVLVQKNLLKKVEPNFTAMTYLNHKNNTADTMLLSVTTELRGPVDKVSA
jgi:hypothetical protein